MTFIVPITPFDYIQYANRTIEAMPKAKVVENMTSIPATKLFLNDNTEWNRFGKRNGLRQSDHRLGLRAKQGNVKKIEDLKVQMTGKGLYINEII